MQQPPDQALTIKLNSTGERLTMWRTLDSQGGQELQMTGCLPGRQQGPPLHVHFSEDESTEVVAGALSVSLDGREFVVDTNDVAFFPKGSVHRWWNDGEEDLVFRGVAAPAVDLDRYLQALFEVINSAQSKNPSVFYMAHLVYRHRKTQLAFRGATIDSTDFVSNRDLRRNFIGKVPRDPLARLPAPLHRCGRHTTGKRLTNCGKTGMCFPSLALDSSL